MRFWQWLKGSGRHHHAKEAAEAIQSADALRAEACALIVERAARRRPADEIVRRLDDFGKAQNG